MSISERVKKIQDEDFQVLVAGERRKRLAEEALDKRYSQELPEAKTQQAILLEKLRETGVVEILEELTGPILPLRDCKGDYVVRGPTKEELGKRAQLALSRLENWRPYPEYAAGILPPEMNKDGSASQGLKMEIIHSKEIGVPNMSGGSGWAHEVVTLRYFQHGQLIISGDRTCFSEEVSREKPQLDKVKEALAQALAHPKRPQYMDPGRIFFGQVI